MKGSCLFRTKNALFWCLIMGVIEDQTTVDVKVFV
jgi:hypothetical protein